MTKEQLTDKYHRIKIGSENIYEYIELIKYFVSKGIQHHRQTEWGDISSWDETHQQLKEYYNSWPTVIMSRGGSNHITGYYITGGGRTSRMMVKDFKKEVGDFKRDTIRDSRMKHYFI